MNLINSKPIMNTLLLLCVTASLFVYLCESDSRPNIIFIFADDWGWNDVGYINQGYIKTDFLDSLAQDGLILSSHYVLATCSPSRAAFLTGRYPAQLGVQHSTISPGDIYGVPLDTQFISNELKSYGYSTHMIGKWHLGYCAWEYTPLYRGFDSFSGYFLGEENYFTHDKTSEGITGYDLRRDKDTVSDADGVYSTYWHYNELSSILQNLNENNPFFIYLAWQNSHSPSEAPDEYLDSFADVAEGARQYFMAQTAVLDDVMKDMINELKEKNLWDNTLIVFSSDNGAELGSGDNAPLRGSKNTLWEGGVRVPAFVTGGYLPDAMRGQTTSEMIHITDWFPTFVSLASQHSDVESEDDSNISGVDVSSVILDGARTTREEILINVDNVDCELSVCGALRYKQYKMIVGGRMVTTNTDDDDCFWTRSYMKDEANNALCSIVPDDVDTQVCGCTETACLFDLEADPCEYYDLAGQDDLQEVYDMMYARLKEHYDSQTHPWKDIFDSDYDGADPSLHGDFWSPWMELEDLVERQTDQMEAWEAEQSSEQYVAVAKRGNVMHDAADHVSSLVSVGVVLTLFAMATVYAGYKCSWLCCICCQEPIAWDDNYEGKPLLA